MTRRLSDWMIEIVLFAMALVGAVFVVGVIVPLVLALAFIALAVFSLHVVLVALVPAYRRHATGSDAGQSHV